MIIVTSSGGSHVAILDFHDLVLEVMNNDDRISWWATSERIVRDI